MDGIDLSSQKKILSKSLSRAQSLMHNIYKRE